MTFISFIYKFDDFFAIEENNQNCHKKWRKFVEKLGACNTVKRQH